MSNLICFLGENDKLRVPEHKVHRKVLDISRSIGCFLMWSRIIIIIIIIIIIKANLGGSCFLYKVGGDENRAQTCRGKYL